MKNFILYAITSCFAAWAEDAVPVKSGVPEDSVLLYDHAARDMARQSGMCLSDRIYVRYSPMKQWNFVQCRHGSFAVPWEILSEGTVVPGAQIGARETSDHFELVSGGQWAKTLRKQKLELIVLAPLPLERTVTFFTLDKNGNLPAAGMPAPVAALPRRRR